MSLSGIHIVPRGPQFRYSGLSDKTKLCPHLPMTLAVGGTLNTNSLEDLYVYCNPVALRMDGQNSVDDSSDFVIMSVSSRSSFVCNFVNSITRNHSTSVSTCINSVIRNHKLCYQEPVYLCI